MRACTHSLTHVNRHKHGYEVPVSYLSRRLGDINQVYTQHAASRVSGCVVMVCAVDNVDGAQLFKIDPAGSCLGWSAASAGSKDSEADNVLEKRLKKKKPVGERETAQFAISALQSVLGADFKASEVEVAVATAGVFRTLSEEEIDAHLTDIAEQD